MNRNDVLRTRIIAAVITVVMAVVAVLTAWLIHGSGGSKVGNYKALNVATVSYAGIVGDKVFLYDGSVLHKFSSDGSDEWGDTISVGKDYSLDINKNGIIGWKGESITMLSVSDGEIIYTDRLDGCEIISAKAGSKYWSMIYEEGDKTVAQIRDTAGNLLDSIELTDSVVLDYGFFADGSYFWLLSVDTSGSVPSSTLTTYKPARKAISGTVTDTEQVSYSGFFESEKICLIGEDYIKYYDYTGTEYTDLKKQVYGWILQDRQDTGTDPVMLFALSSQVGTELSVTEVRLVSDDYDTVLHMPYECHKVLMSGKRVYGFSDQNIMCADVTDTKVTAYSLAINIDDVCGITDDHVAVIQSNGTYYLVTAP